MDMNDVTFRRTVLVVEDEPVNSQLLGFILSEEYNVLYAEDGNRALEILRDNKGTVSMVLTDIKMPEKDGFTLISEIRADEELCMIPIMVLTSESDYEEKSLQLGAIDFLTKPYDMPSIIKARVRRIIELSEGRRIISATEKDYITGLYTREFFFEYGQRRENYSQDRKLDAVVIDLDRFHVINELYGRNFGNKVLKATADAISAFASRNNGIGSREEKDVFHVICTHNDNYDTLVDEIKAGLRQLNPGIRFSLRVGVLPDVDPSVSLLQQFDKARNACNTLLKPGRTVSVAFYSEEMHRKELLEERLLNEMQTALDEKQFEVWYQPKFAIQGEKPVLKSAEALVRWRHPELGMISPGVFIPLFERSGLIDRLDRYVWSESAAQLKKWRNEGLHVSVSVNVSRVDLFDSGVGDVLKGLLKDNGLSFSDLFLEITESAYSEDTSQLIEAIANLHDAGFCIEMDDFGSGYSSLKSLAEMPVDIIKLDMSFIRRIHENKTTLRVVELAIEMAKSLGAPVVAEGVENEDQYRLLKQIGCDYVQGYYFSRPLPVAEFEAFAEQRR